MKRVFDLPGLLSRFVVPAAMGRTSRTTASTRAMSPAPVGIYGWRKRCVYLLVLLVLALSVINAALTIWIVRVMSFNMDGMGKLRVTPEQVRLQGESEFLLPVTVEKIAAQPGVPLSLHSSRNVTLRSLAGNESSSALSLGNGRLEATSEHVEIRNGNGETLFALNRTHCLLSARSLRLREERGISLKQALQTNKIEAEPGHTLSVWSLNESVSIGAADVIHLSSSRLDMQADESISLSSRGGIVLSASSLLLPRLAGNADVLQLCICESGLLFGIAPSQRCSEGQTRFCRPE